MSSITVLHYHDHAMEAVEIDGQRWLRVAQICAPLGLASEFVLRRIVDRNIDEFTPDETRLIALATEGGTQKVRLFSLRGARLLALLARTPEAKAFRRWVLDLLEGRIGPRGAARDVASRPLSTDAKRALEAAMRLIEEEHPAQIALRGMIASGEGLPDDPTLARHADAWEMAIRAQRMAGKEFTRVRRMAAFEGYSEEAVKAEVRRRRAAAQPQLAFAGEPDHAGR